MSIKRQIYGNELRGSITGRGYSAYEVAVQSGFKGTVEEWLESLRGTDGKNAYEYAQDGGYSGTEAEFAAKLAGNILPPVDSSNDGEFLRVVNGAWASVILPNAEEAGF